MEDSWATYQLGVEVRRAWRHRLEREATDLAIVNMMEYELRRGTLSLAPLELKHPTLFEGGVI